MERQMRGKWSFRHHPCLTPGEKDVMYYNATDWNLINLKNCFVGIFHFIFGQLAYCSEGVKEENLKESDWDNHMVWIQSSNGYLFVFHYQQMINNFCIMFWNNACLVLNCMIRGHLGILYCSPMFNWIDALWCCCLRLNQCSSLYSGSA